MRASFDAVQPAVQVIEDGEKIYIFVVVNGEWKERKYDENMPAQQVWECDYREIVTDKSKIDVDAVRENPEKFLDWIEPEEKSDVEVLKMQLAAATDTLDALVLAALEDGDTDV